MILSNMNPNFGSIATFMRNILCQSIHKTIEKDDYDKIGEFNVLVAKSASKAQKIKYHELLSKICECKESGEINNSAFRYLKRHFMSLSMFDRSWYKKPPKQFNYL